MPRSAGGVSIRTVEVVGQLIEALSCGTDPRNGLRQNYIVVLDAPNMDFVVVTDHSPEDCPSSNARVRKMMGEAASKLPALAKSLGVEPVYMGAPMVDHKLFFFLRAPNYEAVRNFLMKSGLVQTQTSHIYPTLSIEDALKQASELTPIH